MPQYPLVLTETVLICCRLTDNLVALKEIRLEHEEGAPCTAIREGKRLKHGYTVANT